MGLCFVGKIRLKDFLEQKLTVNKGHIIDMEGKVLGQHEGLHNYTIGQRQGIKIGGSGPYYVAKKDLKTNTLTVTNNPRHKILETKEVYIHSVNWINSSYKSGTSTYKLAGRYRHQGDLVPLTVTPRGKGEYQIVFKNPQQAVASGQSLVLYKGRECVGGGVIV